ncbi:hypothetical protein [Inquilinus sp. OTU3971]|uniref:hypothetical protein n=1 Tax=Inquilinus sp. OTU3971 TaxID=3043855 RepID=UPI00313F0AE6
MDMAQSDSDEIRPTDPDMKWTGWALDSLRELVTIDLRTKRITSTQQQAMPAGAESIPDFDLKQSRLSRSVRLSIAMTERIRANYLMRRKKRKESGEQEHRRQRREQAAQAVAEAVAQPEDVEYMRSWVWEKLVEDEILDEQLDTLSAEEFVREVCRKIGRPPNPAWMPRGWDDAADIGSDGTVVAPGRCVDLVAVSPTAAEGWAEPPEESGDGCLPSRLSKPDSS